MSAPLYCSCIPGSDHSWECGGGAGTSLITQFKSVRVQRLRSRPDKLIQPEVSAYPTMYGQRGDVYS